MSTIINATTTNGVVIQPDNSGSLELQTNSGTTAVTVDTSQNTTFAGKVTSAGDLILASNGTTTALTIDTSQRAAFVAGTAALPAITTTGDTNTGMFFPAADTIAFAEGGTEAMRLDSNGNVKIGTTATTYDYQTKNLVLADASTAGISITNTTQTLTLTANSAGGYVGTRSNHSLQFTTNDIERMRITSGGEVYIAGTTDRGAFNLQCNGTGVWGAGAYTNGSDERIKENITPIDTGLDVVAKLNPVTYKYKEDWSRDQSIQTGFIAQDLLVALEGKNYIDGIVNQSSEYMSVAYQNIIPILTKAIQEQQTIINDLKARVETLEAK
jgi:hypothetical protein